MGMNLGFANVNKLLKHENLHSGTLLIIENLWAHKLLRHFTQKVPSIFVTSLSTTKIFFVVQRSLKSGQSSS